MNQLPPVRTPTGEGTHSLGVCALTKGRTSKLHALGQDSNLLGHTGQGHAYDFK